MLREVIESLILLSMGKKVSKFITLVGSLIIIVAYQNCSGDFSSFSQSSSLLSNTPNNLDSTAPSDNENSNSLDTSTPKEPKTSCESNNEADCDIKPTISEVTVNVEMRTLTVQLDLGSNQDVVFDYHLGSRTQPNKGDDSISNDLGDSSGVGGQLQYTFSDLPTGDYKVYGRVYYSFDNFTQDIENIIAQGHYIDFIKDISFPELEIPPIRPSNKYIKVGNNPGDAQCLGINKANVAFGSANISNWGSWLGKSPRFFIGQEFLAVENDSKFGKVLRHKFVPNFKGTEWVAMGANITGSQTYRVVQNIFFEKGWDWGGERYQGGKLGFGFGSGTYPTGGKNDPKGFTARLGWRGNRDGTANLIVYSYAADRNTEYGEDFNIGSAPAPIGRWIEVIMEVTTNSSISKSDGSLRAWIDGKLLLEKYNIGWQLDGNKPSIDSLFYMGMYGGHGHEWSPDGTTYMKLGDICWAQVVNGYSGIDPDVGKTQVNPNDRK